MNNLDKHIAILAAIKDQAETQVVAALKAGTTVGTARDVLRSAHKAGLIHIEFWSKPSNGRGSKYLAGYLFGPGQDCKKPKMTSAIRQRAYRLRLQSLPKGSKVTPDSNTGESNVGIQEREQVLD